MTQIHVRPHTKEEYEQKKPTRLQSGLIANEQLFNLMMRNHDGTPDAFLAPVYLKDVERTMATVVFKVLFTDQDLRPLDKGLMSSMHDNFWVPARPLPLTSQTTHGEARTGYFLPYADAFDDDIYAAMEALSHHV